MLNVEQNGAPRVPDDKPLTYDAYLRVSEILSLQTPLSKPPAHDELLFIIVQQAQELWFKQILHELRLIVDLLDDGMIRDALRPLDRTNRIMGIVAEEARVLETMAPQDFHVFRHVLSTSSGFESEQFRELEVASGLKEPTFLKLLERHADVARLRARWPRTLHDAFCDILRRIDPDPVEALVRVYRHSQANWECFMLAEALSEYEVRFNEWRFRHVKLVERTIGDHSPGTAGSSGVGYLGKTLSYRIFPELWETRNRLTAASTRRE